MVVLPRIGVDENILTTLSHDYWSPVVVGTKLGKMSCGGDGLKEEDVSMEQDDIKEQPSNERQVEGKCHLFSVSLR